MIYKKQIYFQLPTNNRTVHSIRFYIFPIHSTSKLTTLNNIIAKIIAKFTFKTCWYSIGVGLYHLLLFDNQNKNSLQIHFDILHDHIDILHDQIDILHNHNDILHIQIHEYHHHSLIHCNKLHKLMITVTIHLYL